MHWSYCVSKYRHLHLQYFSDGHILATDTAIHATTLVCCAPTFSGITLTVMHAVQIDIAGSLCAYVTTDVLAKRAHNHIDTV